MRKNQDKINAKLDEMLENQRLSSFDSFIAALLFFLLAIVSSFLLQSDLLTRILQNKYMLYSFIISALSFCVLLILLMKYIYYAFSNNYIVSKFKFLKEFFVFLILLLSFMIGFIFTIWIPGICTNIIIGIILVILTIFLMFDSYYGWVIPRLVSDLFKKNFPITYTKIKLEMMK